MVEGQGLRTLIVDDSNAVCESLASLLERDARFDVVGRAANGREAIGRADELGPDLILMDLRMPFMSGLDATASIRRRHPHVTVIVLSAYDGEHVRAVCEHVGAHGFVTKIANREQILSDIHRILGEARR